MLSVAFGTRLFQLVTTLALASGPSVSAGAATWYVDDSAPGGTGTSWASPFSTLQAALTAAAASGDEIGLGRGTYKPAGPGGSRSATFTVNKSVTIKGGYCGFADPNGNSGDSVCGSAPSTILSGDLSGDDGANFANNAENSLRVVSVAGTVTVRFENLTVSGGNANGAALTGGGLFVGTGVTVTCQDVRFVSSHANSWGGAIDHNGTGTSVYKECLFEKNRAGQFGGAVSLSSGNGARIANCRFHGNTLTAAGSNGGGGGLWINGPSAIVGCMFTGNSVTANAGLGGGAVAVGTLAGTSSMVNCSLASNLVTPAPVTVALGVGSYAASGLSITNCVFADVEYYLSQFEVQGNANTTYCLNSGEAGTGNINAFVEFVDLNGSDNIIGTDDDEMVLQARYSGGTGVDVANAAALPSDFADLDNDGNTTEAWPEQLLGESGAGVRFA